LLRQKLTELVDTILVDKREGKGTLNSNQIIVYYLGSVKNLCWQGVFAKLSVLHANERGPSLHTD